MTVFANLYSSGMRFLNGEVISYLGEKSDIIIPYYFNEESVVAVASRAFADRQITGVTFPSSLKRIGREAFANTLITKLVFPASVEEIADGAFSSCNLLTQVIFEGEQAPAVGSEPFTFTEDGKTYYSNALILVPDGNAENKPYLNYRKQVYLRDYASLIFPLSHADKSGYVTEDDVLLGYIGDQSDLTTLTVPDGIKSIADFAFYNCATVKTVVTPEGFEKIGKYAFYNCTAVQNLDVPSTLKEIDDYAFTGFFVGNNISRLYLPEGFTRIGDGAFMSSFNLKIVELPQSLQYVGYLAFGMSNSLERMYFNSLTPPTVGTFTDNNGQTLCQIFSIINSGKTIIYVPHGKVGDKNVIESYKQSEGFKDFASYIKIKPEGAEVGHYGNGEIFVDLDGADTITLSVIVPSENDTTDMGGSRYEYEQTVGSYSITGAKITATLPGYGTIEGAYVNRMIAFTVDGITYQLFEPYYYYDSYNWTTFKLYPSSVNGKEGKGIFDMYGSFLTPFEWKINNALFSIKIDGNNKLPENADYAGVKEYVGSYDAAAERFTVSFMLNDYATVMDFTAQRNDVGYSSGEITRLIGKYVCYAENGSVLFSLYSYANGFIDVYIGEALYEDCTYTMKNGVIKIDMYSMIIELTMDKNGNLSGNVYGVEAFFVYEDELMDSTKMPD